MCGIAGWIDCRRLCDSAAIMRRMAQTMVPRGPDSGGFYTDDNCALAHRRLSVIDPARSAQPMTRKTALDSYTIVYNGELYNTAEIRSELESTGISFTSSGRHGGTALGIHHLGRSLPRQAQRNIRLCRVAGKGKTALPSP